MPCALPQSADDARRRCEVHVGNPKWEKILPHIPLNGVSLPPIYFGIEVELVAARHKPKV
jgi:hypothetical protein